MRAYENLEGVFPRRKQCWLFVALGSSGVAVSCQPACAWVQLVRLRRGRTTSRPLPQVPQRIPRPSFAGERGASRCRWWCTRRGILACSKTQICSFSEGVGFTARNPTPPPERVRLSEETRAEGVREFARDMRDSDWEDEAACRPRRALLLNVAQRHTRCVSTACALGPAASAYPTSVMTGWP